MRPRDVVRACDGRACDGCASDGGRASWAGLGVRLRHGLAWGGAAALDLMLPPHCPACERPVDRTGSFCAACYGALVFVGEPCCGGCGRAFASAALGGAQQRCEECRRSPPPWRAARAALRYDRRSAPLILGLKYGDRGDLARLLAGHMARAGEALLREADLLAPVPLHRWRLLRRRYNQAGLLAARLGRLSGTAVVQDLLARRGPATSMRGRTGSERQAAAAGAFVVRPHRRALLAGRRVLLIDDVLTTGATARACAAALLSAGAASVDVLAAARAGGEPGAAPLPEDDGSQDGEDGARGGEDGERVADEGSNRPRRSAAWLGDEE